MNIFDGVDFKTVFLYIALTIVGVLCITSASYDAGDPEPFAFAHNHMKQIMWVGIAWVTAFVVMMLDSRYFHMLAYPAYLGGILILIAVLIFGREVNGAKAWFQFGSIRVQPVEFAKIAIALAVARMMSGYSFSINRPSNLFKLGAMLLLPLSIIVLQNDTGSGIVLGSFLFVFYREGLNKWLCIPILLVALLFIVSFLVAPTALLIALILIFTIIEVMMNRIWRSRIVALAAVFLGSMVLHWLLRWCGVEWEYYISLMISSFVAVAAIAIYAFRSNLRNIFVLLALYMASMIFLPTTEHIFNNILKPHQQNRILVFLGAIEDLRGQGYNVHQSKIAIGSGGLFGKGFMQGTQSKYFVPEKHTDFIFCTAGEEWGFIGSLIVLGLLCALILRLMKMGERQQEPFSRIYCYCVASIFLFHAMVNLGMTIGLVPVMGIPLPFISYGGSSMIAFTILLFIAIRLDASPTKGLTALN